MLLGVNDICKALPAVWGTPKCCHLMKGSAPSLKGCRRSWSGQIHTPRATGEFYVAFKEVQSNMGQTPQVLTECTNRKSLLEKGETVAKVFSEHCRI